MTKKIYFYFFVGYYILAHVLFFMSLDYLLTTKSYHWMIVGLAAYILVKIVGPNAGLHRYFCHRSFKTSKFWEYVMSYTSIFSLAGDPIGYSAIHRYHHSPAANYYEGKSFLEFEKAHLYDQQKWAKDLFWKKHLIFVHEFGPLIIAVYILLLYLILPELVYFVFAWPAVFCVSPFVGGSLHYFAHNRYGYQNFPMDNNSKNFWLCNLLTLGEGLHNNHHHKTQAWNFSVKPTEIDPTAWFIRMIKK